VCRKCKSFLAGDAVFCRKCGKHRHIDKRVNAQFRRLSEQFLNPSECDMQATTTLPVSFCLQLMSKCCISVPTLDELGIAIRQFRISNAGFICQTDDGLDLQTFAAISSLPIESCPEFYKENRCVMDLHIAFIYEHHTHMKREAFIDSRARSQILDNIPSVHPLEALPGLAVMFYAGFVAASLEHTRSHPAQAHL